MANSTSKIKANGVSYIINDPTIAPVFNESSSYSAGDYVKHGGNLYRFTADHAAGEFVTTDCVQVTVGGDVRDLKNALIISDYVAPAMGNVEDDGTQSVTTTKTSGMINKSDGTETEYSNYSISSFTASKDKIYKIIYQAGARYYQLRAIELSQNSTVVASIDNPPTSDTYTVYLHDFEGTVRVSYRDQNANSFKVFVEMTKVDKASNQIDLENWMMSLSDAFVIDSSTGKWVASTAKHVCYPVKENDVVNITADKATRYTLLKSNSFASGESADFCTGYSTAILLNAGDSTGNITIPADCNYVYFNAIDTSNRVLLPAKFVVNGIDYAYTIRKRIDESVANEQWIGDILAGQASDKVIHFSIDDTRFWTGLLASPAPESVWDVSEFANLKAVHEASGACITLMCFLQADDLDMANIPNTWASEFQAAKGWLRFALHAKDSSTNYADNTSGATDYAAFVQNIYRITGDYGCIDRMPRLANFAGKLAQCRAMADLSYGPIGFLSADDTRLSYYLDQTKIDKLNAHGRYYDTYERFVFIPSLPRLDTGTTAQTGIDAIETRKSKADKYVEIFCHQSTTASATNTRVSRFSDVAQWATSHGYSNGFLMDYFS